MFYIIGDCKDITVKGLEIMKRCDKVYLEAYTSILTCGTEALDFYGRKLMVADWDLVEQGVDDVLSGTKSTDVALLVVGDPFEPTKHTDLVLRARERSVDTRVVHNASILNAVDCSCRVLRRLPQFPIGLRVENQTVFMRRLFLIIGISCTSLCFLDIKVKQFTLESLTKKYKEYMPPKFMSVSEASQQLLGILKNKGQDDLVTENTLCIGLARVGSETQKILACSLQEMSQVDLGGPLRSLIIAGPVLHPLEIEYLENFKGGINLN